MANFLQSLATPSYPDSFIEKEFPTQTHLNYAISRALRRGSTLEPRRPPLPLEIVILIFDATRITQSMPSHKLSVKAAGPVPWEDSLSLYSTPITRIWLSRVRQMVLVIRSSRGRKWASSWFETQIKYYDEQGKFVPKVVEYDESPSRWVSRVDIGMEGVLFSPDHEIWEHLEEGDVLVARAQLGYVSRISQEGELLFWEKFDPTILG